MSKSLGNVLDPLAVIERFGSDALRFYLLREVPFGQDGSVATTSFEGRYESELANELGNLASRTIGMLHRYRDGIAPVAAPDAALGTELAGLPDEVAALIDRAELTQALDAIWRAVRRLNRYVEERAPWRLAKEDGAEAELDEVLATLLAGLRVVAVLLEPFLPASMGRLLDALGIEERTLAAARWEGGGLAGMEIARIESLFPKDVAEATA
jgi:methionyl-tRNA synthetase